MRRSSSPKNVGVLFLVALAGCGRSCWKGDTGLDTNEPPITVDTQETGDTEVDHPGVHGSINGHVAVTLVWEDESGQLSEIPWEESCFGEVFPYGQIFVEAMTRDEETGVESHYGDDLIVSPQVDPALNAYTIAVETDETDEVYLYAALDKWDDRIISSNDPVGYYPNAVQVTGGSTVNDVDIEIFVLYWCGYEGHGPGYGPCPDCPSGWGSSGSCYYWDGTQWAYIPGCGGGSCADGVVTVGGPLVVDVPYNGNGHDLATILFTADGEPWSVGYDLPVTDLGAKGATGTWGHTYCAYAGSYQALGCWDSNANGLSDPADVWGQPLDADGNPVDVVTFGGIDDIDITMLVPVAGAGIEVVPFVRLSGDLVRVDGTWDELLAEYPETRLFVVADKYRPTGDYTEGDLESSYDYAVYEPEDLAGATSLPFTVLAPSDTTLFLWTSADLNADGVINGVDEGFGSYGSDGRLTTSEVSISGIELEYDLGGED